MAADSPCRSWSAGASLRFPASGEINRRLDDPNAALDRIRQPPTAPTPLSVDETDGVGIDFSDWRFNLRLSNTEPLIRLNVESRGDRRTDEVSATGNRTPV